MADQDPEQDEDQPPVSAVSTSENEPKMVMIDSVEDLDELLVRGRSTCDTLGIGGITVDDNVLAKFETLLTKECEFEEYFTDSIALVSNIGGRICDLLSLILEQAEAIVALIEAPTVPFQYNELLPALGKGLKDNQRIYGLIFHLRQDISVAADHISWETFLDGMYRCRNLCVVRFGAPELSDKKRLKELSRAMLTTPHESRCFATSVTKRHKTGCLQRKLIMFHFIVFACPSWRLGRMVPKPDSSDAILPFVQVIEENMDVKRLKLDGGNVSQEIMTLLISYCRTNEWLKLLELEECRVSLECLKELIWDLPNIPRLETLGLTRPKGLSLEDKQAVNDSLLDVLAGSEHRMGCTTLRFVKLDQPTPEPILFYLELNRRGYRANHLSHAPNETWLSILAEAHTTKSGASDRDNDKVASGEEEKTKSNALSFGYFIIREDPQRWCCGL